MSTNGGVEPLWAASGREIFYRETTNGAMIVASLRTAPTFTVEGRTRLFDATPYMLVNGWHGYDVTEDGQRFLMVRDSVRPIDQESTSRLVLVQNFFEELRRLVPN